MSWLLSNWVERRASKDQNLRNAAAVWKQAQSALAGACDSLAKYYSGVATVKRTQQTDDLVIIAITRNLQAPGRMPTTNVVFVQYHSETPKIVITFDGGRIQEFPIKADSDHGFISSQGSELGFDEFSRLSLEEAFFAPSYQAQSSGGLRIVR